MKHPSGCNRRFIRHGPPEAFNQKYQLISTVIHRRFSVQSPCIRVNSSTVMNHNLSTPTRTKRSSKKMSSPHSTGKTTVCIISKITRRIIKTKTCGHGLKKNECTSTWLISRRIHRSWMPSKGSGSIHARMQRTINISRQKKCSVKRCSVSLNT